MKCIVCIGLFSFLSMTLTAQIPTTLTVRAKAKDAKFIGSSIGGAFIKVTDALTGEVLAKGYTKGSTGNTTTIMSQAHNRYDQLADINTASFQTQIPLSEPTLITIEATAPARHRGAAIKASTQIWLIPGRNILGDGIIIEIPGFVVDILKPNTHQFISKDSLDMGLLTIKASMVMMCGCTISDGGTWNAREMEVTAIIKMDGAPFRSLPMANGNIPNIFEGSFLVEEAGQYQITVYGFDPRTYNAGVDVVNIIIK